MKRDSICFTDSGEMRCIAISVSFGISDIPDGLACKSSTFTSTPRRILPGYFMGSSICHSGGYAFLTTLLQLCTLS